MFCYQCQETIQNTGCTVAGACGKKADIANLQDELVRQLKILALQYECRSEGINEAGLLTMQSLFMTITNANFDGEKIQSQIDKVKALQSCGSCCCAAKPELPAGVLATENEDLRSLRELLIYGLKGIAAYADHAAVLGKENPDIYAFAFKALAATTKDLSVDELVGLVLECGKVAVDTMALLDGANTGTFGNPEITSVKLGVGNRPGILISGHDLLDLKELLEQSADQGIDIYTHGEMLPAHYYPELKKYGHLYGNYGNAWHKQNTEFASFNGPILMTTNCITPVQPAYANRIFTTGMAGYPGVKHIADRKPGQTKDFSEIIALAKTCPAPTELESGELVGGFAHNQVLALADKVIAAVKSGAIKRFVVMAGCDGRHKTREYFTEVAETLPKDTIILTAGCAKYRYNKLNLGDIGGIPRVLDAGQCNDSYSLALIALALKDAFELSDINELPLSFDIGWYEQKAVAVLLALLHLGVKGIRLGPTLPAFLSPAVAKVLVENFDIKPTTDAASDVAAMMKGA
ncbi:MAG: hydroxylamine reductase [Lentisphaeria bacterium]|nr:hydroxylamine reductase [Lentisphaeria bacterium]